MGRARRWHERARREAAAGARAARLNDAWRAELVAIGRDGQDQHVVDEVGPSTRARYADARARTIALDRSAVVAQCGARSMTKLCACGPKLVEVGCGQVLLCDRCRRPFYRRLRRRALAAVTARLAEATSEWARAGRRRGRRPQIVLTTLTVPRYEGGRLMPLDERRARLVDGWRKLRQWLHRRIGRFPFVAMPELTPGADGTGHLHYHVVCIWPWWDWTESQAEWRRATGLSDANPPDMRVVNRPKTAAHYVAKYASKGTNIDDEKMTAELVGAFVSAFYGKRRVIPSVGFWVPMPPPVCPCCTESIIVVERPVPTVNAVALWRARRGIHGVPEAPPPPIDRDWLQLAPRW